MIFFIYILLRAGLTAHRELNFTCFYAKLLKRDSMMGHRKRTIYGVSLIVFVSLLAGCSTSQIEQIPPQEILARSAERMASLAGFEFVIDRTGESVFLDYNETISFRRAEGQFTSPERVYSKIRIIAPGLVTEVQIISLGEAQWETNLLTGEWQASDPVYSFNTSRIFDPENGIPSVLAQDLVNPILTGIEELPEVPGKELYVVEAELLGERAYQMTYGMIDNDPLQIKVWIAPDSFDLYRIILVDPADPGDDEDTLWQIDFWNFDHTFEIEKPPLKNE
jgi:hypothetical protein